MFSYIYNNIDQKEEYLAFAKSCIEFAKNNCIDDDKRMFFTVTEEGLEIQKRRYYFSETFAAIGCAEYYRATKNEKVLEDAEKFFAVAYECFKGIRKTQPKVNTENVKNKALSPVMIMLSTARTMSSVTNNEKYSDIAKECVDEILHGGFLKNTALLECVGTDGSFVDSPSGRVVNPGHSMEAAWFLMAEGIVTNDDEIIKTAKNIIDVTWKLGWDEKNGGLIAFTDVYNQPPVALEWDMKLWWPQCETIIALSMAYMLFKEPEYKNKLDMVLAYCDKYFVDKDFGEWYGYLHYDNTVSTSLKGNIFKGPFHVPRMYMIMQIMEDYGNIDKYIL